MCIHIPIWAVNWSCRMFEIMFPPGIFSWKTSVLRPANNNNFKLLQQDPRGTQTTK